MITTIEIAEQARVSTRTVGRVLNNERSKSRLKVLTSYIELLEKEIVLVKNQIRNIEKK